jgi:hypothetical protein
MSCSQAQAHSVPRRSTAAHHAILRCRCQNLAQTIDSLPPGFPSYALYAFGTSLDRVKLLFHAIGQTISRLRRGMPSSHERGERASAKGAGGDGAGLARACRGGGAQGTTRQRSTVRMRSSVIGLSGLIGEPEPSLRHLQQGRTGRLFEFVCKGERLSRKAAILVGPRHTP